MIPQSDRMVATSDGTFVSERVQNVVEAIREYDENIEVQYIPVRARVGNEPAFRLVHNIPGGEPYVMFHVKDESEFDARVLKKIIMNDQAKNKTHVSEYDAWEETKRRIFNQQFKDRLEEANDIAFHVLRSPLNTYRVDKNTVIKDHGNRRRW